MKQGETYRQILLDHLNAVVGERILRTQYHGDDYPQPPAKAGIFLTYEWTDVREKRIVPALALTGGRAMWHGEQYLHIAEYKIGNLNPRITNLLEDRWEDKASGALLGIAMGPYHFWSQRFVEDVLGKTWPDYVLEMCVGEKMKDLLRKKKADGYAVTI